MLVKRVSIRFLIIIVVVILIFLTNVGIIFNSNTTISQISTISAIQVNDRNTYRNNQNGLVSYWKFDEGSGTTVIDSVGDNNGTSSGATWTNGQVGGALNFDGVDDYVEVPSNNELDLTGDFTIEAWVKPENTSDYMCIIDKYEYSSPNGYGYFLLIYSGNLMLRIYSGSNGNKYISGTTELRNNKWHHVVGINNGTNISIYVDGVLEGSIVYDYPPEPTPSNNNLGIGKHLSGWWAGNMYFNGIIDEVGIYNIALTDEEILQHYNDGLLHHGYLRPDTNPPNILSTDPNNKATDVSISSSIRITFNEAINITSAQDAFSISPPVSGNFSWDGFIMVFIPGATLNVSTIYVVIIESYTRDLAGNTLTSVYSFSFTTSKTAPPPRTVSYWKFDEDNGTIAYDTIGSNHGTIHGATWTTGQVGIALKFDGLTDYVDCGNDDSFNIYDAMTIEVWVKLNSKKNQGIVYKGSFKNEWGPWSLSYSQGVQNKGFFFVINNGNLIVHTSDIDLGTWYHLAATYDGQTARIYLNGVLQNSSSFDFLTPISIDNNPVQIGRYYGISSPRYLKGIVDEVAIYNYALTTEEIYQHYNASLSGDDYYEEDRKDDEDKKRPEEYLIGVSIGIIVFIVIIIIIIIAIKIRKISKKIITHPPTTQQPPPKPSEEVPTSYSSPPSYPPPGYLIPGYKRVGSNTEQGVKFVYWSLLLFLSAILIIIIFMMAIIVVIQIITPSNESFGSGIGLAILFSVMIFGAIIMLIGAFIFIIIGIVKFYQGKHEFLGPHAKNVEFGTYCIILMIMLYLLNIYISIMFISTISSIISITLNMLFIIFVGLMFHNMIKDIAKKNDKNLLKTGLILFIISGLISFIITITLSTELIGDVSYTDATLLFIGTSISGLIGIIMVIIGLILFFIAYRHTLQNMEAGIIVPNFLVLFPPAYPPPCPKCRSKMIYEYQSYKWYCTKCNQYPEIKLKEKEQKEMKSKHRMQKAKKIPLKGFGIENKEILDQSDKK